MGIFYNPLDGPITGQKIIGIIIYALLAFISIWATSESLITSFSLPSPIAYIVGAAFVLMMAMFLSVIKQMLEERRIGILNLLLVILGFGLAWTISLATNSHKFFTQLKLNDIRKHELDIATIELENIGNNSLSIGNQVIDDYNHFVTSRIQDYKKEVMNVDNCGHGPVADTLMGLVQRSMPGSSFTIPSGRARTPSSCRKLANEMASLMNVELNTRILSMRERLNDLENCNNEDYRSKIIAELQSQNSFINDFTKNEVKEILSQSHEYYNQLYQCYNNGLIQSIGSVKEFTAAREFKSKLELPVPSIELEKISSLKDFVFNYPKNNPGSYVGSFLLSVAIAFVLDLGAFIIFYFIVLKKDY